MLRFGLIKSIFRTSKLMTTSKYKVFPRQISNNQHLCTLKSLNEKGSFGTDDKVFGTMNEVRSAMIKRLGLETGYCQVPKPREHLLKYEPKLQDLPARSMQDSFTAAIIPLSTDKNLQNLYVTVSGSVRLGRLMEDMDMFAVWVCHQHLNIPNLDAEIHLPYTFVTILVDKVDFTDFEPRYNKDIRLSGHVSWVGRTSMEIVVWLEQKNANGIYQKITRALFLMAARNATNMNSAPVNPIVPADEEEQKILDGGIQRKNRRKAIQASSLLKVEPNAFEDKIIHNLFMRTMPKDTMALNERILPTNCRWIEDSIVSNVTLSFPENRNAHNKVFGGYLMRNASEISWVCAYQYCGRRPKLENMCDVSFQKPIDVASLIKMTAHVVYTEMNYVQILTTADIINPEGNEAITSNVFYFTFSINDKVREILPRSYHEAIWYLEGRRKLLYALNLSDGMN